MSLEDDTELPVLPADWDSLSALETQGDEETRDERIKLAIQDFRYFLILVWETLNLPRPTRMQLHIAEYLQTTGNRKVLQALRGIGKTWITAAYVCWRLLRNVNERVLIVSQTTDHAEKIAYFIWQLLYSMDILNHLLPDETQRASKVKFDVAGSIQNPQPSVSAVGITSQLQGNRASLLISDDVEGQQNSATEARREQLRQYTAEYEAILQTNDDAEIVVLGTPQTSESIYTGMFESGYHTRIFPARYPEDVSVYRGCLAPYIVDDMAKDSSLVGKPLDSRFTDEDLTRREQRYGRSGFKLQFMLDTTLSDAERYPLKLSDLVVTDLGKTTAPSECRWSSAKSLEEIPNLGFSGDCLRRGQVTEDQLKYNEKVLVIDPAGRGKDETAVAIVANIHGTIYLLESRGVAGGYGEEGLVELAMLAKEYAVHTCLIESNFGDGMFASLLTPIMNSIYPVALEEVRQSTQKEARIIDTLEPVMNSHRLVVDYSLVARDAREALKTPQSLKYSLLYQMSHLSRDRGSLAHDDRLDAVAMGVSYLRERGAIELDSKAMLERLKAKRLEEEMEAVHRHFRLKNKKPLPAGAFRGISALEKLK